MELADLHNRRDNIAFVSRRAKEHSYPYLAWPEDSELLTLADLPTFAAVTDANKPKDWLTLRFKTGFFATDDTELRNNVVAGNAYARITSLGQFAGTYIAEYQVVTR